MSPSERRAATVRLLADVDQMIQEGELRAADPLLSESVRRVVLVQLDFRRKAVARVEEMLGNPDQGEM